MTALRVIRVWRCRYASGGAVAGDCVERLLVNAVGIIGFIGLFAAAGEKFLAQDVRWRA